MEVEDEVHFILKCPFYDDLRNPILQLANLQYPNFTELTNLEQLKVIFQSEDLLKTASFCLNRMYNRRSQMLTSNWLLLNYYYPCLPIRHKLGWLNFRWVLENCV